MIGNRNLNESLEKLAEQYGKEKLMISLMNSNSNVQKTNVRIVENLETYPDRMRYRAWDSFMKCMWGEDECYAKDLATFFKEFQEASVGENEPILMQCTGLRDKKQKLIYESDILEFDLTIWNHADNKFVIEWNGEDSSFEGFGTSYDWTHYCTIIGNKYENPELMEQVT